MIITHISCQQCIYEAYKGYKIYRVLCYFPILPRLSGICKSLRLIGMDEIDGDPKLSSYVIVRIKKGMPRKQGPLFSW